VKSLSTEDQRHFEAAQGWLILGDYLEANEELERITLLCSSCCVPTSPIEGFGPRYAADVRCDETRTAYSVGTLDEIANRTLIRSVEQQTGSQFRPHTAR